MTLTTPLLIPSVSSPGFPLDQDGIAESSLFLQYALDSLDEALLVSAYDVEHRRLRDADALLRGDAAGTVFDRPRLLVIDSGGYETGQSWESGHVERSDTTAAPYDAATFARVVDRLPAERPTLVVSYDEPRQGYGEQIRRAQAFFAPRTHSPATSFGSPRPADGTPHATEVRHRVLLPRSDVECPRHRLRLSAGLVKMRPRPAELRPASIGSSRPGHGWRTCRGTGDRPPSTGRRRRNEIRSYRMATRPAAVEFLRACG